MKIFKTLIFSLIFLTSANVVSAGECKTLYMRYKVFPEIKSSRGWKRVIKKQKLSKYTNGFIQPDDNKFLKQCLIKDGFNVKHYYRSIGEKL